MLQTRALSLKRLSLGRLSLVGVFLVATLAVSGSVARADCGAVIPPPVVSPSAGVSERALAASVYEFNTSVAQLAGGCLDSPFQSGASDAVAVYARSLLAGIDVQARRSGLSLERIPPTEGGISYLDLGQIRLLRRCNTNSTPVQTGWQGWVQAAINAYGVGSPHAQMLKSFLDSGGMSYTIPDGLTTADTPDRLLRNFYSPPTKAEIVAFERDAKIMFAHTKIEDFLDGIGPLAAAGMVIYMAKDPNGAYARLGASRAGRFLNAVGEFVESDPGDVWDFISRWGRHPQQDLRLAVATCLLEHLLEFHFGAYFHQVEQLALSDPLFGDTVRQCWQFGQTLEPGNAERFVSLTERIA